MPLYIYNCAECGKEVEFYQSYDVEKRIDPLCPNCREVMRRVWQPTHVHFKGKGWYVKDRYNPDTHG